MFFINETCHKFSVIKDSGKYRIVKKFDFFVCKLFVSHFFRMIFEALIKKCLNILNTIQNNISGIRLFNGWSKYFMKDIFGKSIEQRQLLPQGAF